MVNVHFLIERGSGKVQSRGYITSNHVLSMGSCVISKGSSAGLFSETIGEDTVQIMFQPFDML